VWSVECGVWSAECGVWSLECGVLAPHTKPLQAPVRPLRGWSSIKHRPVGNNLIAVSAFQPQDLIGFARQIGGDGIG
jgi:hypothetical protein